MVNHTQDERLAAGARGAEQQANEFKPQECANTAWAFAAVNESEQANTAWALASVNSQAKSSFAERQAREFKPQELTNMAWAFATVNSRSSPKAAWAWLLGAGLRLFAHHVRFVFYNKTCGSS